MLAQGSGKGYDVVLFDVIWPAEYAQNKVLVDVSGQDHARSTKDCVLPGAYTTVKYDGKSYYGMPWILDTKYLFYNKKMLKQAGIDAACHLGRAESDAKKIKEAGIVKYPIAWWWSQAEAAICDYTTLLTPMAAIS